jgi:hypothetical protein
MPGRYRARGSTARRGPAPDGWPGGRPGTVLPAQRHHEDGGLHEHDRRAACRVQPEAQVQPDDRAQDPDADRDRDEATEAAGNELARRGRRHEHRDDEDDPDGLEADDDGQGDEGEEEVVELHDRQARRCRPEGVEGRIEELLPQKRDDGEHDDREAAEREQVADPDPEDLAEQESEEVAHVVRDEAEEEDPEREHAGEQHTDGGVAPQVAATGDPADRERRADSCDRRPDIERALQEVRHDDTRKRRVAQGVAHERQAAQDHIAPDHRADEAHDRGGHERANEEGEGERPEDRVDGIHPPSRPWK